MNKEMIQKNFSRNAAHYSAHSTVQKKCAKKLFDMICLRNFDNILEIGCGTGFYTNMLRERYPAAQITAVDISPEMINLAKKEYACRNVKFEVLDAEKVFPERKFDLITSNAVFQWFENIGVSVKHFAKILNPGGSFCFSIYGRETFAEFEQVLNLYWGVNNILSSSRFLPEETISKVMKESFKEVVVKSLFLKTQFCSLMDFLQEIKFSGCRGEGLKNQHFLGKNMFKNLENLYLDKFGGITATHHLIFYSAKQDK
ncbi:MAG: methyltransferase domain-containing protein [Candidatus Omnitrophota bacterium]